MNLIGGNSKKKWDNLVLKEGTPFQSTSMLEIFESHWKGDFTPFHIFSEKSNKEALIPLYLYNKCPRLDYYKRNGGNFNYKVMMSHALVGWYGFPISNDNQTLIKILEEACNIADINQSALFLTGIDARDKNLISILKKEGFYLDRFHTLTVRDLRHIEGDPTCYLSKKRRGRVRSAVNKAISAGVSLDSYKSEYRDIVARLIHNILIEDNVNSDVLPLDFILAILDNAPEGIDILVALSPDKIPIGIHINFYWNKKYYIWLAGHDRSLLKKYQQSHFLFEESIKKALHHNCIEIQAGRDPYTPKIQHGFHKSPLLGAIKSSSPSLHEESVKWLKNLAERHKQLH